MPILRQIAQLGHPILRQVAAHIQNPADSAIQSLINDLLVTVADANGVGIAAPQVYDSCALFIIASRPNARYPHAPLMEPTAMINPELLWYGKELESGWEGCLSIPGLRGLVPRYTRIGVRYLSRIGEVCEAEYTGFLARVFQHEYDHLQGRVFIDRMISSQDLVTEKEYQRLLAAEDNGRKQ
jgi:peptide deformylase